METQCTALLLDVESQAGFSGPLCPSWQRDACDAWRRECPVAKILEGMEWVENGDSLISAPGATTKLDLEGL